MTILITGAAGFIGSHTTDRLLADGHVVIGLDNLRTGRLENLQSARRYGEFYFKQVDITEHGRLDAVVGQTRPSAIIHLAALVSVQESILNPVLNRRLNVKATELVARAAVAHGVRRIVFASSAAVYGDCAQLPLNESAPTYPLSPYGAAKLESEKFLFASAQNDVSSAFCLRYFNVYGPRQDARSPYSGVISIFGQRFAAGESITIYGDGEQTRDFIHVSDVARANARAATFPGRAPDKAINICTGRTTSLKQLNQIFRNYYQDAPAGSHAEARPGDIRHSCGDPSAAQTVLGFSAEVPIQDGLRAFCAEEVAREARN
jgi:UDP-glucose 4-epimerase